MTKSSIGIINYEVGNLFNLQKTILHLGYNSELIESPQEIEKQKFILLPGVGAFQTGIENLKKRNLHNSILTYIDSNKPLLGICLGMQLLLDNSEEDGIHSGLGIFKGSVNKLKTDKKNKIIKVPHTGWNELIINDRNIKSKNPFFKFLIQKPSMYFSHSYGAEITNSDDVLTFTKYGENIFASIIAKNNVYGAQFHPELSDKNGLDFLNNLLLQYF